MPWHSRLLRGQRVWARSTPDGKLAATSDGRVEILYQPGGKVYRASARNLEADPAPAVLPDGDAAPGASAQKVSPTVAPAPKEASAAQRSEVSPLRLGRRGARREDAFIVYADGACTGNPGPCGIGVVLLDGSARKELSEYLGEGTNNIAELMAIVRALEESPRDRTVVVHSDSAYALGLLGKAWKAKANRELVERMRVLGREFRDLRLVKVAGHAGIPENERADELARDAVVRRR